MNRIDVIRAFLKVAAIASIASYCIFAYAKPNSYVEKALVDEQVINLRLEGNERQRLLYVTPAHPHAVIVMLPGGAGNIAIEKDGDIQHGKNFLVRTRLQWVALGYAVVIPDSIDHVNLRGLRSSTRYAALLGKIVHFARDQTHVPLFLLGTSQGSIAAVNGAAHLPKGEIKGVILTESVSVLGGSHETVFDAEPSRVSVPALVVANYDDRCNVAPPSMAPKIAEAMSNSPKVKILYVSGGTEHSDNPCGSLTAHGYYGIEEKVIHDISQWINENLM